MLIRTNEQEKSSSGQEEAYKFILSGTSRLYIVIASI